VSGATPPTDYSRRLKLVVFLGTAVGACLGSVVAVVAIGVAFAPVVLVLVAVAVIGCAAGGAAGWWFVLRHDTELRMPLGLSLVFVSSLVVCTPMALLLLPLAWPAAGLAGLVTLNFLERSARA